MGRSRRSSPPREPATPSQAALRAWLRGPPRRPQILLAVACRVSQPLISGYARRVFRPGPDSEVAKLLEIATGGLVTPSGWLTPAELAERDARRTEAAAFARAIASGAQVELTTTYELPNKRRRSSRIRQARRGSAVQRRKTSKSSRRSVRRSS